MKPKDLQIPFDWEQRCVTLSDRVWYATRGCIDRSTFLFPGWSDTLFFGNHNPVVVEYCCGNGLWIAQKAKQNPGINWVAVEVKFERVRKVWAKIKNENLPNLVVAFGEAFELTERFFPAQSIQEVYVNFPDPWPKRRHSKNRLLKADFIQQMYRILRPEGGVIVATDDSLYSTYLIEQFQQIEGFKSLFPSPYYSTEWPDYGSSYFEALWRSQGKQIRYHHYIKL